MGCLRVKEFIGVVGKTKDITSICCIEKKYLDDNYSTVGSRKTAYSAYRKGIKESFLNETLKEKCINTFKLTREEMSEYKQDYNSKVVAEHDNLKLIFNYKEYIKKAVSLLDAKNYSDKVLGFAALTGRRVGEIGCTADFLFKNNDEVIFTGQLKTRIEEDDIKYVIPVLYNSKDLIKKFKDFRSTYTQYLNLPEKFHNNISKYLSLNVKKHFSVFVEGDITPKDLRSIYSTIVLATMKKNKSQSDQRYVAVILGHGDDDLNTSNSYFDYVLSEKY
jgi:hypothetical protein